jgi:hypothetical protein
MAIFTHFEKHFYYNNKGYISCIQPPFLSISPFITHFSDQWPSQGRVALLGCRVAENRQPNGMIPNPCLVNDPLVN